MHDEGSPAEQLVWISGAVGSDADRLDDLARLVGPETLRHLGIYKIPASFKLSVAIPVYNEERWLREIMRRVRAVPIRKEIVLVDDCSKDGTRDILREMENDPDVKVIYHERNLGKGGAIRTAFSHCTGDVVVIQDADLEYDPSEYPRLLQPILDGRADVVYGSRFIGETVRVHLFRHRIANGILTFLSNCMTNLNLTDMETCYKLFKREVLKDIKIKQNRFGMEPEITAKIARRRCRVYEMPISYSGRDYSEGKKIGWKDGFEALWCILRYGIAD